MVQWSVEVQTKSESRRNDPGTVEPSENSHQEKEMGEKNRAGNLPEVHDRAQLHVHPATAR
jgi:hypothetical protein